MQVIPFRTGKDAATALFAGEIDAAVLGIEHAITGQVEGKPLKQLVLLNRLPGWTIITSPTASVNEIGDLRGKRIGITSPGSATHVLLTYLLYRQNISQDQYTAVRAGVATLPDILAQGGIDAGVALEPHGSTAILDGKARLLLDLRSEQAVRETFGTNYPVTSLLVRQDVIDRRRADVQHLANALVWASKWLQESNADDVINLLPREYIPDPQVWRRSFDQSREVFSPDGAIDTAGIRTVIAAQVAFGQLNSPDQVDPRTLYDLAFWERASSIPVPAPPRTDATEIERRSSRSLVLLLVALVGVLLAAGAWLIWSRARSKGAPA